jgi:hypothetical protein
MTTYTPEEIAAALDEAQALKNEIDAVMVEVAAALAPYEYPGVVVYPEHCDALLAAISSENFDYQVGEGRNKGSSTATPVAKWMKCNAKNRRAIARVRNELAALTAASETPKTTKRITFNRDSCDFDCFVTIDGKEDYIGSAPTNHAGEIKCNQYAIAFYEDNHTPEKAASLIMANQFALA